MSKTYIRLLLSGLFLTFFQNQSFALKYGGGEYSGNTKTPANGTYSFTDIQPQLLEKFLNNSVVLGASSSYSDETLFNNGSKAVLLNGQISNTEYVDVLKEIEDFKEENKKPVMSSGTSSSIAIQGAISHSGGIAIGMSSYSEQHGTAIGDNATATYQGTAIGASAIATNRGSVALGVQAGADGKGSIAIGDNATVLSDNTKFGGIAIGKKSYSEIGVSIGESAKSYRDGIAIGIEAEALGLNSVAIGNNSATTDDEEDVVSVGNTLKGIQRKIINLAAGEISEESTDAVNGSQLYEVELTATEAKSGVSELRQDLGEVEQDVKQAKFSIIALNDSVVEVRNDVAGVIESLEEVSDVANEAKNGISDLRHDLDFLDFDVKTNRSNIQILTDSMIETREDIEGVIEVLEEVGEVANEAKDLAITNKDNIFQINQRLDTINQLSTTHNEVIDSHNQRIERLEDRVDGLDRKVDGLNTKIAKVDKRLRGGIAASNAIASLGQATQVGKNAISVGVGSYRDAQALAIGVSRVSDNGKWTLKMNSAVNKSASKADLSFGASATYQW